MNKIVKVLTVFVLAFALCLLNGCKSEKVMTYKEYVALEVDKEVCVDTYIQAKQGWWEKDGEGVATFYTQDNDGGYFLYNMPCTKSQYDELVVGTKIRVKGTKAVWAGEVEIVNATFEVLKGNYIAKPTDVSSIYGTDELENKQNTLIEVKGYTVAPSLNDKGEEVAFLYNYNGSGERGSDVYFNLSNGNKVFTFVVESYLCGADTDVYKACEALSIGQVVNLEGFLYWYEGPQPHVTKITVVQ